MRMPAEYRSVTSSPVRISVLGLWQLAWSLSCQAQWLTKHVSVLSYSV